MPTPQEVERAREWMETQRNTGIFSSQHEDVYDLLAAYHAHASAEEAASCVKQPCGHCASLEVRSVESPAIMCELCEMRSQRNDALEMEKHYKEKLSEEAEKYRRLTGGLSKFLDGAERHYCDSCAGLELDGKYESAEEFLARLPADDPIRRIPSWYAYSFEFANRYAAERRVR